MFFSHTGDFNKISAIINIKIYQDGGQGRTAPILSNSLEKGAFSLRRRLPRKAAPGKNCWIMAAIEVQLSAREAPSL
jgi:hypothetical protein